MFHSIESIPSQSIVLSEDLPLVGPHKVTYRRGEDWDFDASTTNAPVDISLVMPPHRPKNQPEHHRTNMFVGTESGPMRIRVCRHCLSRPFNLEVSGGASDVTIWIPSNFKGFITFFGPGKTSFSAGFANHILPNVYHNSPAPKHWRGDEVTISTAGNVILKMWDVCTKQPEVPAKELWKRMFRSGERRPSKTHQLNWDFLIEDDDSADTDYHSSRAS